MRHTHLCTWVFLKCRFWWCWQQQQLMGGLGRWRLPIDVSTMAKHSGCPSVMPSIVLGWLMKAMFSQLCLVGWARSLIWMLCKMIYSTVAHRLRQTLPDQCKGLWSKTKNQDQNLCPVIRRLLLQIRWILRAQGHDNHSSCKMNVENNEMCVQWDSQDISQHTGACKGRLGEEMDSAAGGMHRKRNRDFSLGHKHVWKDAAELGGKQQKV